MGRAIVREPKVFLMDEPLGTLDTEFRDLMCEELRHLHDRIKATTVYVTHDQIEARPNPVITILTTRLACMNSSMKENPAALTGATTP